MSVCPKNDQRTFALETATALDLEPFNRAQLNRSAHVLRFDLLATGPASLESPGAEVVLLLLPLAIP